MSGYKTKTVGGGKHSAELSLLGQLVPLVTFVDLL